jgi:hypothetical protein
MSVLVFCILTLCGLVGRYQRFEEHTVSIFSRWRTVHSSETLVSTYIVALGGLVVSVLANGPKVRGFKPGRERWILRVIKSVARLPSEGKVKPSVPCRRFTACKRTLRAR